MRHIPEDELHAYLDQALSRSQCVEIESHLAICAACRAQRDGIAALRDRTTALLSTLAPARRPVPPFAAVRTRQASDAARRQHRLRQAAWAASLVAAVAAGWGLNRAVDGPAAPRVVAANPAAPGSELAGGAPEQIAAAPSPVVSDTTPAAPDTPAADERSTPAAPRPVRQRPVQPPALPAPELATARVGAGVDTGAPGAALEGAARRPSSLQVSSLGLPGKDDVELDGVWRTVSWENARAETGRSPAHVDGLPVVGVQVQQAPSGGQPVMVVAQQLGSGEVIRTIEGPADDVSSMLQRTARTNSSPWPSIQGGVGGALASGQGIFTMQGDRILAITAPGLSSDSLAAMLRRVNASGGR